MYVVYASYTLRVAPGNTLNEQSYVCAWLLPKHHDAGSFQVRVPREKKWWPTVVLKRTCWGDLLRGLLQCGRLGRQAECGMHKSSIEGKSRQTS